MLGTCCQIDLISPHELSEPDCEAWLRMLRANADLDSPYFLPDFVRLVARFRDDVRIVRVRDGDTSILFWPMQRVGRRGYPVGYPLNDFHALIGESDRLAGVSPSDVRTMLKFAGVATWSFVGLLPRDPLQRYAAVREPALALDLTDGYEAFLARLAETGTQQLKQLSRKRRKLGREIGPVTLETEATDLPALRQLFDWKSEQYRRTGRPDVLATRWTRELLESLLELPCDGDLRPCFSILRAGQMPVAMHLGIRTAQIAHWWFPGYDPSYAKYSAGKILLLELAAALSEKSIIRLDLGPGKEAYKQQFGTCQGEVAQGTVDLQLPRFLLRRGALRAWDGFKRSRFTAPMKQLVRRLRISGVAADGPRR